MMVLKEDNKKPGISYAITTDGIELPVVDISHPAFALRITAAEQKARVDTFLKEGPPLRFLPKPIRNLLLRFFLRDSILAKGIYAAHGTFMSGTQTYLLKLGPEMLGAAYAKPIDRKIAAALPSLGVRLRLQDIAQLMAEYLLPVLTWDRSRPLAFVNIAGGPGIDSLNTLILLEKQCPGVNAQRQISIDVLDMDDAGPAFGKAALAALSGTAGPLEGMPVQFRHTRYNWSEPENLKLFLQKPRLQGALVLCSSEGGLFEYGSDTEIELNLSALRNAENVLAVVGSVTRADEPTQRLREMAAPATRPRGLELFHSLAQKAGWRIARAIERPFSDQVVLTPASGAFTNHLPSESRPVRNC